MSKDEYVRPRPFPTDWTPDLEEITRKSDFEAVLLGLGRLMVAFNRLEQQLFDAVRYLVNHEDWETATAVASDRRRIGDLLGLIERIVKVKFSDRETLDAFAALKAEIIERVQARNVLIHSRWYIGKRGKGAALRVKAEGGSDRSHDVSIDDIEMEVEKLEDCASNAETFFDFRLGHGEMKAAHMQRMINDLMAGKIRLED
jgi:hypothetical protein